MEVYGSRTAAGSVLVRPFFQDVGEISRGIFERLPLRNRPSEPDIRQAQGGFTRRKC